MHTLKHPMMTKLGIIKLLKDNNNIDILCDEIALDLKNPNEMIRSWNIILANKLNNDNLVEYNKSNKTNNIKLENSNISPCKINLRKSKSKNKKSPIANIQKHQKIKSSSKK